MLIVHICTKCGCPDMWAGNHTTTACPTRNAVPTPTDAKRRDCYWQQNAHPVEHHQGFPCVWGPPETRPEWDAITGKEILELRVPGSRIKGSSDTCDGDDCRRFYAEQTGTTYYDMPSPGAEATL